MGRIRLVVMFLTGAALALMTAFGSAVRAGDLDYMPLPAGSKVLQDRTTSTTPQGSGSNLHIPANGTFSIDFAIQSGGRLRLALLSEEQYEQAARGERVAGPPLMQAEVGGSGTRSMNLGRGDYFVYFAALDGPRVNFSYRASYRPQ